MHFPCGAVTRTFELGGDYNHTECLTVHVTARGADEPDPAETTTTGRIACRCDRRTGECITCTGDECLDP